MWVKHDTKNNWRQVQFNNFYVSTCWVNASPLQQKHAVSITFHFRICHVTYKIDLSTSTKNKGPVSPELTWTFEISTFWHIFWQSFWHIFRHSLWHLFWHSMWRSFWHVFCRSFWHFFVAILFGTLFGIYSAILFGIYSGIHSGILSGI